MKEHTDNYSIIFVPQIVAIIMLLWAIMPNNPYAYFILLRWICCPIFAYLAFRAYESSKTNWVWILGVTSAIYNPIIPAHLTREIWVILNLIAVILAINSIFLLKIKGVEENI